MLEIIKFRVPIERLPNETYHVEIADCERHVGEVLNSRLIIPNYNIDTIQKGMAYSSVPLTLIEYIDTDIEIIHPFFKEIGRCGNIIRYYIM